VIDLERPPGGIIFDLDGTLLNTEPLYSIAAQTVLDEYGHTYTMDIKRQEMGKDIRSSSKIIIEAYNLPISAEEYVVKRERALRELLLKVVEIDGAGEFVEAVHRTGVPFGLATSTYQNLARYKLSQRHWGDLFRHRIYGDDPNIKKGKPSPDIFLLCADAIGQAPERCIAFEDSTTGIAAAKAAGMQVFAVESQFFQPSDLDQADRIIKGYRDLLPLVEAWQTAGIPC
jgi:pseudouridine-5'-monophosphatase